MKSNTEITIQKANNLSIYKRRKMLKFVMLRLYHDLKEIKNEKIKYKDQEVNKEMRLRAYKIISNLTWEKFEHRMCESETQVKIQNIIDFCKDNLKKELHCFEIYTKLYTATLSEKILMKPSGIPLIGKFFYNRLVLNSYERYDLLLTISDTLSEVLDSKQFLKEEFKNWDDIVKELQIQLNSFERARDILLKGSPKLVTAIQTKKAGKTILNYGFHLLNKLNHSGEIDELEFKKLSHQLDRIHGRLLKVQSYIYKYTKIQKNAIKKKNDDQISDYNIGNNIKIFLIKRF